MSQEEKPDGFFPTLLRFQAVLQKWRELMVL